MMNKEIAEETRVDEAGLTKAMNFFLWEVYPIRAYAQSIDHTMLQLARKLRGFVPFSSIDMISENLQDEAKEAYLVLLREEEKGNSKVEEYWMHPRWRTFQIQSFKTRLEESKKGNVQFVIWIDSAKENSKTEIFDKLEAEFPGLLD